MAERVNVDGISLGADQLNPAASAEPGHESVDAIYLVLSPDGAIQSCNRSAARLLLGGALRGTPALSDVVHRDAANAVRVAVGSLLTGARRRELVVPIAGRARRPAPEVYVHLILSTDWTPSVPEGSPILVQGWDVTALMRRVRELETHAFHDSLTGLPNRATFMDRLHHEVSRSARTGRDTAVMFVDIDGFKAVNDRYGHAVGDDRRSARRSCGRALGHARRPGCRHAVCRRRLCGRRRP